MADQVIPAEEGNGGVLVLVTGTGRSGTSTVAGTLHHLGLFVPGPYLNANASNPKGFFESSWAVRFHKEITRGADIEDFDGRPEAFDLAAAAVTPAMRHELTSWLKEQAAEAGQVVVKDPRSVWAQHLWRDAAADAGLAIRYLSMLRHPAEVVGSRATYYASAADADRRRRYEICSVGRWVNASVISERQTRGAHRSFVPYADLLSDWRRTMTRVRDELGLSYNADLSAAVPHAVDEFVDPDLRRVRVSWAELSVPEELVAIAQQTWDCLSDLATAEAVGGETSERMDHLAARYAQLYSDSAAISLDASAAAVRAARATVRQDGRPEAQPSGRPRQRRRGAGGPPSNLENRRVRDVTARQLLGLLRARAARRIRRRRR